MCRSCYYTPQTAICWVMNKLNVAAVYSAISIEVTCIERHWLEGTLECDVDEDKLRGQHVHVIKETGAAERRHWWRPSSEWCSRTAPFPCKQIISQSVNQVEWWLILNYWPCVDDGESLAGPVVKVEALHRLQGNVPLLGRRQQLTVAHPHGRLFQSFRHVRIAHVHHAGLFQSTLIYINQIRAESEPNPSRIKTVGDSPGLGQREPNLSQIWPVRDNPGLNQSEPNLAQIWLVRAKPGWAKAKRAKFEPNLAR